MNADDPCKCGQPVAWHGRINTPNAAPGFVIITVCDDCKKTINRLPIVSKWIRCEEVSQ